MDYKIETISINEFPEGVVPFKYVVEEIGCSYSALRMVGIRNGLKFYKYANMVLCVNKEEFINAWHNRPKVGRPWHKETK